MTWTTNRVFVWIRSWFVRSREYRQAMDAQRRIQRMEWRVARSMAALQKAETSLRKWLDRRMARLAKMEAKIDERRAELERALEQRAADREASIEAIRSIVRQYEDEMDRLRKENEIHKYVELPGVVTAHKALVQMCEAQLALQARRQRMYTAGEAQPDYGE